MSARFRARSALRSPRFLAGAPLLLLTACAAPKVGVYPGLVFNGNSRFAVRPAESAPALERALIGHGYRIAPSAGEATYLVETSTTSRGYVRVTDLETGDPVAQGEGRDAERVLDEILRRVRAHRLGRRD